MECANVDLYFIATKSCIFSGSEKFFVLYCPTVQRERQTDRQRERDTKGERNNILPILCHTHWENPIASVGKYVKK